MQGQCMDPFYLQYDIASSTADLLTYSTEHACLRPQRRRMQVLHIESTIAVSQCGSYTVHTPTVRLARRPHGTNGAVQPDMCTVNEKAFEQAAPLKIGGATNEVLCARGSRIGDICT